MTVPETMRDAQRASTGLAGNPAASGSRSAAMAGPPPGVVAAGDVLTGRTFAAVAIAWRAAAPHRRRLVAAVGRRVATLRSSGVDVTVISRDGSVPAELLAGCRVARGDAGPEAMRGILAVLARRGVGPGLLLAVGSEFGAPGGNPGPDAALLVPEAARVTAVSVGPEPDGVPAGVVHAGGGSQGLLALLDEQVRRHARQRVPAVDEDPEWILSETGAGPAGRRVTESLFTLGAGGVATRGSVEETAAGAQPMILAAGVYDGTGPGQHLLLGPVWTGLAVEPVPAGDRRVLDLRTGVLERTELTDGPCPLRTVRLASITMPGVEQCSHRLPRCCTAASTTSARCASSTPRTRTGPWWPPGLPGSWPCSGVTRCSPPGCCCLGRQPGRGHRNLLPVSLLRSRTGHLARAERSGKVVPALRQGRSAPGRRLPAWALHLSGNRSVRGRGLTAAWRPRRSRASRRRNAASAGLMVTGTGAGFRRVRAAGGSPARLAAQRCLAWASGSGGPRRRPARMTAVSSGSCPRGWGSSRRASWSPAGPR
jgi:hypothetical protein